MTNKKVLLVEDDKMISNMYQTKLKQEGFEILIAEDGVGALAVTRRAKPDIILLDVILPQLDGFSVLEEIRKDNKIKNTPVIMLTNLGTTEDKDKAKRLGANDYLVKASLTPSEVSAAVKKYLQ
jgi:DNA-binding response OmpR family regulator